MNEQCAPETVPGLYEVELARQDITEIFTTAAALGGQPAIDIFRRLDGSLRNRPGARILRENVFGLVNCACGTTDLRKYTPSDAVWPVTQVAEAGVHGGITAGVQVHAIIGAKVQPIRMNNMVIGTYFEDQYARYCLLGEIHPDNPTASREAQALRTFEMMEQALKPVGMDFSHVMRTWFYLDHILDWYGPFNRIRDTFFKERGIFDGLVPASTGVGGRNREGTALVADALAIQPKDAQVRIQALPSPLQCPALEYGSSFSRAVEVIMPDHRRIFVSGTASIYPDGRTANVGDVGAQIDLTMQVAGAILESRGMGWEDASRAVAYIKDAQNAPLFNQYCAAESLPPLPVVLSEQDICRDDLLFEIEVEAVRSLC